MVSNQQFRLKWNNHRNTVLQEFGTLLHNNSFVDCTIGAEGKYVKAHKIILSACSPYFQNVFSEHFDKHPVVLLKDVLFKELKCMIDYMYCGEVNISECELPSFLRTAQSLKIKGLAEDISEYDSASDSEQAVSSYSENSRTVEANVEIHDDDGPPAKKSSTPCILSTKIVNDSMAGRKRKSPNSTVPSAGKSNSQARVGTVKVSNSTKSDEFSNSGTETEISSQCSASKEDISPEDNDSSRKAPSQNDLREPSKKAEVKEEPVENDIDNDDNSSYECGNNICEDTDPLNEDSESNCANSGNKFSEVSIASVSSYNENDANDGMAHHQVKEEMFSEVIMLPDDCDINGDKLGVRSPSELLSMVEYTNDGSAEQCITENEEVEEDDDDLKNGIIVEVQTFDDDCCEVPTKPPKTLATGQQLALTSSSSSPSPSSASLIDSIVICDEQGNQHSRRSLFRQYRNSVPQPSVETIVVPVTTAAAYTATVAAARRGLRKRYKAKVESSSGDSNSSGFVGNATCVTTATICGALNQNQNQHQQQMFRKILPASLRPTPILPLPLAASSVAPARRTRRSFSAHRHQDALTTANAAAAATPYQVIKVPAANNRQFCSTAAEMTSDLSAQVLCSSSDGGGVSGSGGGGGGGNGVAVGVDEFCHGTVVLNNAPCQSTNDLSRINQSEVQAQNIFVLNPATSRVMLLNSDVVTTSEAVQTFTVTRPSVSSSKDLAGKLSSVPFVQSPKLINVASAATINDLSAVIRHTSSVKKPGNLGRIIPVTKFRKIAPQPAPSSGR